MTNSNKKNYLGLSVAQTSYIVSKLIDENPNQNVLIVAPNEKIASEVHTDIEFFTDQTKREALYLEPWDYDRLEGLSPFVENSANRIEILNKLKQKEFILTLTPKTLIEKYPSYELLGNARIEIYNSLQISSVELQNKLSLLGYRSRSIVERVGDFSSRGQVLDIYPPCSNNSIRVEFFGSKILSIREFSLETQRSIKEINKIEILGVSEIFFGEKIKKSQIDNLKQRADDLNISYRELENIFSSLSENKPWPGLEELAPEVYQNYIPIWSIIPQNTTIAIIDSISCRRNLYDTFDNYKSKQETSESEYIISPKLENSHISAEQVKEFIIDSASLIFDSALGSGKQNGASYSRADLALSSNKKLTADLKSYYLSLQNSSNKKTSPIHPYFKNLQSFSSIICCPNKLIKKRISKLLKDNNIQFRDYSGSYQNWLRDRPEGVSIVNAYINEGFIDSENKIAIFSDTELLPNSISVKPSKARQTSKNYIRSTELLEVNDFIVHEDYGIGIYRGIKEVQVDGKLGDFIILEFEGGDNLLIPAQNLAKLQKYEGLTDKKPKLNKLGGTTWQNERKKVKKTALELAGKLINLYAQRTLAEGTSFSTGPESDEYFASQFPYQETPDQLKAIQDVISDMESPKPMDRLVCGDVGYGKTEVAMRAAYKATAFDKQVAVVVPTTVLADQHFSSFKERFEDTDINICCVSRFYTPKENKDSLNKLKNGKVQIIIGTHRLLSSDVDFKDLGLLIIDEEHRFGVAHKEKLKEIKKGVDVLTLTATPIPRTLHMSLLSIRELSTIETPPQNRLPIRTYLSEYNNKIVVDAISKELDRGGQVYFVHNKVKNIEVITNELKELLPNAKIDFAHGQMKPKQLDDIMHSFTMGEIDVLVSTTIIESGLDIPNANTIIIKDADKFGLAALYQLRGRVGRSSKRGYAYLFISKNRKLTNEAQKRLDVLQSIDDLGVGYRLALQDLQIRGAGNLLGKDQSGSVAKVGFDMYTKILKQAIEVQKSGKNQTTDSIEDINPEIKIGFPAHIPSDYIDCLSQRMLLYSRLNNITLLDHPLDIIEEIEDLYGKAPDDIISLVELMSLKAMLKHYGISNLMYKTKSLNITFSPKVNLDPDRIIELVQTSKGKYRLTTNGTLKFDTTGLELESPNDFARAVTNVMNKIKPSSDQRSLHA